jgi:hypothetical protein
MYYALPSKKNIKGKKHNLTIHAPTETGFSGPLA